MAELVTHQFCVIGKAAVAGDLVLPPLSPPQKNQKYRWWKMYRGEGCSLFSEIFALVFTLFQHGLFIFFLIYIYIYVYTYIKFDDEAGFSIFCSFVLFSHHHPDSLAFPSLGERRGSSPSCLGVMFPRGDRGGLLLSDLFAILNKLLTEVTIFAFSEECRFFVLFFFPWGL